MHATQWGVHGGMGRRPGGPAVRSPGPRLARALKVQTGRGNLSGRPAGGPRHRPRRETQGPGKASWPGAAAGVAGRLVVKSSLGTGTRRKPERSHTGTEAARRTARGRVRGPLAPSAMMLRAQGPASVTVPARRGLSAPTGSLSERGRTERAKCTSEGMHFGT
jgi:hypothetical protein